MVSTRGPVRQDSTRAAAELASLLDQLFRRVDIDGDGRITKGELVSAILKRAPGTSSAAAQSWAEQIIKEFDHDRSGSIELDEFKIFMGQRIEHARAVFEALDRSQTGRISREDVHSGLKQAGVRHLDADVNRVLAAMGAGTDEGVTSEGVSFAGFFDVSVLLPAMGAEQTLLGLSGALPMTSAPAGTTPTMIVAAGFLNGAVSRTCTAPTDRLRATLATGLYPDVGSAFRGILREQGVRGFWSSNTANVIQVAPENGISFALNELLRDKLCADAAHPTMAEKFLLGSTAGAGAYTGFQPAPLTSHPCVTCYASADR